MTRPSPRRKYSGTIAYIHASDTGRFARNALAGYGLTLPSGWDVRGYGNYDENHARNAAADEFWGDYLWFMDDDHWFGADILQKLLAHDADVVAPLVLQRRPPFLPVCGRGSDHLRLDQLPADGLTEVDWTGTAGMLIRREILQDLDRPIFRSVDLPDGTHIPSDTNFCRKLQDQNVSIMVDCSVTMGHLNAVEVRPAHRQGRWHTEYRIGNELYFDVAHGQVPLEVLS